MPILERKCFSEGIGIEHRIKDNISNISVSNSRQTHDSLKQIHVVTLSKEAKLQK